MVPQYTSPVRRLAGTNMTNTVFRALQKHTSPVAAARTRNRLAQKPVQTGNAKLGSANSCHACHGHVHNMQQVGHVASGTKMDYLTRGRVISTLGPPYPISPWVLTLCFYFFTGDTVV